MKIIEIPDNKECEDLVDDSIQLISKIAPKTKDTTFPLLSKTKYSRIN